MDNLNPDLKALFDQTGISDDQLTDINTATFIYDFIEEQGGMEAIKKNMSAAAVPPAAPPYQAPPPPSAPSHGMHNLTGLPLVREKSGKFKVREKSGNFTICQGNLEFC